jgi:hypothetical protein
MWTVMQCVSGRQGPGKGILLFEILLHLKTNLLDPPENLLEDRNESVESFPSSPPKCLLRLQPLTYPDIFCPGVKTPMIGTNNGPSKDACVPTSGTCENLTW